MPSQRTIMEMKIEPGAEMLLKQMGRKMKLKARSRILDRAIAHIRQTEHISDVAAWFSEPRFAAERRTTLRISQDNADWLSDVAALTGWGRPALLLDMVYLAAAHMDGADYEAAR